MEGGYATTLPSAPVSGGRRRGTRRVSAKTIKRTLKHLGLRPKGRMVLKGGAEAEAAADTEVMPPSGGRRHRKRGGRTRRRRSRMFGMF